MIAALVAVLLAAATPVPAAPVAPHLVAVDAAEIPDRVSGRADDPRCGPAAPSPVPDGKPIRVVMPPAKAFTVGAIPAAMWRRPPVTDPTWRLNFQGLMWVRPPARRAALDGQKKSLAAPARSSPGRPGPASR